MRASRIISQAERCLLSKDPSEKDEKKAVNLLSSIVYPKSPNLELPPSSKRLADASALLAFCCEFSLGVSQDFKRCESLYISAASNSNGLAMARLAFLRRYGRPGVKIDRVEAEEWVSRVNQQGPNAVGWLLKAAQDYDHPAANYAIGVCYHDGVGVEKSPETAVYYYRRSADANEPRGIGILAFCFGEGRAVLDMLSAARVLTTLRHSRIWCRTE